MPAAPRSPVSRYRRRILAGGLIAAGALYSLGAPVFNNRIEADLERRVPAELAEAGFDGVVAEFSGQDGTLRCRAPLDDPEAAGEVAYDVWGVRAITVDRSCRINRSSPSSEADTASASDGAGEATLADVIAGDQRLGYFSVLITEASLTSELTAGETTVLAPTDAAFDALRADLNAQLRSDPELLASVLRHHFIDGELRRSELTAGEVTAADGTPISVTGSGSSLEVGGARLVESDIVAANGVVHVIDAVLLPPIGEAPDRTSPVQVVQSGEVAALVDGGVVTLTGVVASEVERARLANAVRTVVGADRVVDQLTVEGNRRIDPDVAAKLAQLVAGAAPYLVSGSVGFDGASLYLSGSFADEAGRIALEQVAAAVGIPADLQQQATLGPEQAAALTAGLHEFVVANPIEFEAGSAVLAESAAAVLDEVAARILAVPGVAVTIEGHTDSDGDPEQNRFLSQQRAEAVRVALAERGLDPALLTAIGLGSDEPVVIGGVEDKAASRRVEFTAAVA